MGMFTALGVVLLTHLTASEREPAGVRIAAAGALPIVAVTLYFTFSRGGIGAAIVGVVLYVVLAHPRGLLAALPAAGLPLAIALNRAYDSELLARFDFATAPARAQGRSLLVVVVACALAAARPARAVAAPRQEAGAGADRRALAQGRVRRRGRRRVARARGGHRGVRPARPDRRSAPGVRARQHAAGRPRPALAPDEGRQQRPAGDLGCRARRRPRAHPWRGTGAGTFRLDWERERPAPPAQVADGHSLYYEVRAELGWVGIALLLVVFAVPLGVAISRLRGPGRHSHAAFLAAAMALLLHAMVDWDWEMPALFVWFFGAAGAVLAAPAAARAREPRRLTRLVAGLALLLVAVTPLTVARSQSRLDVAVHALHARRLRARRRTPRSTASTRSARRPRRSRSSAGATLAPASRSSRWRRCATPQRRDPDDWHYAYGLAVTQALAGEDPRPAADLARRLNPLEPMTIALQRRLKSASAAPPASGRGAPPIPSVNGERRAGARLSELRSVELRASARRRCDGAAPGRRSAARCRRGGPGWPRSR